MSMFPFEFEMPGGLLFMAAVPAVLLVLRYTLVDSPRLQLALSAAVRVIVVLLLVLSLAGTLWLRQSEDLAVLILADQSDSVPEGGAEQLRDFLAQVVDRAGSTVQVGLIQFAGDAETVVPPQCKPVIPEDPAPPASGGQTDPEAALLRARQIAPTGTVNRIVLFSDGNETRGNALAAARQCAAGGVRVYTKAYETDTRDEVLLEDLTTPAEVLKGQSFTLTTAAHSTSDVDAAFVLYRNGFKVQEETISLKRGVNALSFEEREPADGLTTYALHVRCSKDYFADNNIASGIVYVAGEPRVLLLEQRERDARYLARALEAENIRVEVREGRGMPGSLEELAAFDAVVLSDVPATDLSVGQMDLLKRYVEDLGGGFLMIGGEDSFGLGGYYRTSVDEMLPVRVRGEKRKDTPSLALMLVIDRSGSMSGLKIELAKEAAIAAVELLGANDQVGVVVFDGEPHWVVDLQSAANQGGIIQVLGSIDAGGGTNIYPAMVEADDALSLTSAATKHVVLLTDGQSQPGDFSGIVDQMRASRITVSTVAVGEGADTQLLQNIANWGNGRYYFTSDPYDIPQIFTKETMSAAKSSLVEEPFLPQPFTPGQVTASIPWEDAPFLFGYVMTTPKPTADVLLTTERGDPLYAVWQFGLGKAAGFTSDAKNRWASDWVRWPGYTRFWAQAVRGLMRQSTNAGSETTLTLAGGKARIVVDTIDPSGSFVNGLTTEAQVLGPGHDASVVSLAQTAPGRYEAEVPCEDTGSYLFRIRQTAPGENGEETVVGEFTRGLTSSYLPEYRRLAVDTAFLEKLAEAGGGTYEPSLDELFTVAPEEAVTVRKRIWPWLTGLALLLFVLDVALRRLDLAGYGIAGRDQRYG